MSSPLVIVGMSGGVDSSVTAWLLQQQGYEVQGCLSAIGMRTKNGCCGHPGLPGCTQSLRAARHRVAQGELRRRIPRTRLQLLSSKSTRAGRTPNPDVLCNREIKFGVCFDYARRLGADWVATGHYARVFTRSRRVRLLKGLDPAKDQSYFLHAMPGMLSLAPCSRSVECTRRKCDASLASSRCPCSTRRTARASAYRGTPLRRIFVALSACATRRHRVDRRPRAGPAPRPHVLHARTAAGVADRRQTAIVWLARFVAHKDLRRNVLVVVQGHDHPALMRARLTARQLTWVAGAPPAGAFRCAAKVRYRQADQACAVHMQTNRSCAMCLMSRSAPSRLVNMSCSIRTMSAWAAAS